MTMEQVPLSMILAARDAMMSATALALYRKDNPGYLHVAQTYPHLVSQMDDLTLGWTILPKAIIGSADGFKRYYDVYTSNLESGFYPSLPEEVTPEEYKEIILKALDYAKQNILPLLEKLQHNKQVLVGNLLPEEVKNLGIAEPSEEDFSEEDAGGEGEKD